MVLPPPNQKFWLAYARGEGYVLEDSTSDLKRDTKIVSLALRKQSIHLGHQMRQSHKLFNKN